MFRIGHLEYGVSHRILHYLAVVFVFHIQLYGTVASRTITVKAVKRQKTFSSFSKIPLVKCMSRITSDFRSLFTHSRRGQNIKETIEKFKCSSYTVSVTFDSSRSMNSQVDTQESSTSTSHKGVKWLKCFT
jgi:hypothetical protein